MEKKIWKLLSAEFTPAGTAGLMGNLFAESGLTPNNLENSYNNKLAYSDTAYTNAVDSGKYTKEDFIYDSAGYGIAQWTYWSRKKKLYEFAKATNRSIGNLEMQTEFLIKELKESFTNSVYNILKTSNDVLECSNVVLHKFENPYNAKAQETVRYNYSMKYYNKFVKGGSIYMIKTYNKNDRTQLSKNFNAYEFRCGIGGYCGCSTIKIDDKLVEILQKMRDHFGKPVNITSAYRCASYNAKIGGANGSYHTKGQAADINITGVAPAELAKYAETIGVKGIGLYSWGIHVDTRTSKFFWYSDAQTPRTTFGGTPQQESAGTAPKPSAGSEYSTLYQGCKGEEVRDLQAKLNKYSKAKHLGFVLVEDGSYGSGTASGVRAFQKAEDLSTDGVAGPITRKALDIAVEKLDQSSGVDAAANYNVKITASGLNVRSGAGKNYPIVGMVYKNSIQKILEEYNGWGKIEKPSGWVDLSYTVKL